MFTDDDERFDAEDRCYQMDLAAGGEGSLFVCELDDGTSLTIGSLGGYTTLTRLSVSTEILLTKYESKHRFWDEPPVQLVGMLPSNLKYLCLYDYKRGE